MPRLIDVSSRTVLPSALTLRVGDLLIVRATGGAVVAGDAVEALGAFGAAALRPDGTVIAAVGGPDAVVFRAFRSGRAQIKIVKGDPWGPHQASYIDVDIAD